MALIGKSSLLAAVVLSAGPQTWGQQSAEAVIDPVNGRTVEQLVELAMRKNGDVLVTRQQVAVAQGGLVQARQRPNPSLDVSGTQELRGPMNTFMAGASIPLELYGRRDRRIEVAQGGIRVSEFDQADVERRLRGDVESQFGEVLASARNLQFTGDLLAINREALRLTTARAEQGAVPSLDADLLRVEVNRIDSSRADFEARLGVAVLELKSLVGMLPEDDLRLKGTLEPAPTLVTREDAVRRALESRPDLRSAREAERVANAKLKQAQTEGRMDASLSGTYQRMDSSFDLNGLTAAGQLSPIQGIFHFATIGVSITLPTRNRNEGAVAIAFAEIEAAKRRREYAELVVAREVAAAFLQQAKAKESLEIYSRGVRDQARQNLTVIRRVYELGRNQLLDVIAEQRRLIEIETGYTEAMNRYYQASVRLRIAAGLD